MVTWTEAGKAWLALQRQPPGAGPGVYRTPPAILPSLRDVHEELAALRRELGCEDFVSWHTVSIAYPALAAQVDEAGHELLARDRAARAPVPGSVQPLPCPGDTRPRPGFAPGRPVHG